MNKSTFLMALFFTLSIQAQYRAKVFKIPEKENVICQAIDMNTIRDTTTVLNMGLPVSGLVVSGKVTFGDTQDSYTRVILKDKNKTEYLVYENYPLLSGQKHTSFNKVGLETVLLNGIIPAELKIEVNDASIQLDSVYCTPFLKLNKNYRVDSANLRKEQGQAIAEQLNRQLEEKHMPWIAGQTSVSSLSYEERKKMFGPRVPCLYGFDYYKGGLYVVSPFHSNKMKTEQNSTRSESFVKDFDWRNRHGKNWITSVKTQVRNTCWDFASVATVESNFNIYFNYVFEDSIANNLSEQELVSCLDNDGKTIYKRLYEGGFSSCALNYIQRKGIVREECFPWGGEIPCESKCDTPLEQVSFGSFRNLFRRTFTYSSSDEIVDTLKKAIIKSPVVVDRYRLDAGLGHSVSCVGFHQIQMGDTLCHSFSKPYMVVVDSTNSSFVGLTGWVIKNSWGDDWGEKGYAKMAFEGAMYTIYELSGPYTSLIYSDADRCVTDEDMDGYYTWGSGAKPTNLPIWIPDEQDGDDSNPIVGAMDEFGNCDTLTVSPAVIWYINSNVNYSSTDIFTYPNIVVLQDGILKISGSTMTMKSGATIRVQNGGKLIVNGGQILEADIVVENGGSLIIGEGGLVRLRHDGQYRTQIGAKVTINQGKIENN